MSLSGRGLGLIALTFLLAIIGLWTQDATLQGLWRLPAGLILVGLAIEGFLARRRRFRLQVESASRGYLGRAIDGLLVLDNPERAPLSIELVLAAPPGVAVAGGARILRASGGSQTREPLSLTPKRLGAAQWPALRTRVLGLFGLAWWPRVVPQQAPLTVGPDLLGAAAQRVAGSQEGATAGRARGAGAELHQLREYRVGDPLHRIDWKASARRGTLVTREFTEDQHLDIIVALDAGRSSRLAAGALDRLGIFANVAARFAEHAIAHDDRVGLLVYAEKVQCVVAPTRGRAAVTRIRSALEATAHAAAESSPLAAALRIRTLARHRSLVVLLTDLDDVSTAGELTRAVRLLQMRHLVIVAGVEVPEIEALAAAKASGWTDPYRALAAREWHARSRAQLNSLRSAGTPVIAARPPELEAAILSYYARLRRQRRV